MKDGRFMSGGGVTSGIDFALAVAAELAGPLNSQVAQLFIEYNPDPPFHAGHPKTAPREVLDIAHKLLRARRRVSFRWANERSGSADVPVSMPHIVTAVDD